MESDDDNDAFDFEQRDWHRMNEEMKKAGYIEGIEKGKEESLQRSFDETFKITFKHSMRIGQLRGIIEYLLKSREYVSLEMLNDELKTEEESIKNFRFELPESEEEIVKLRDDLISENEKKYEEFKKKFISAHPGGDNEAIKTITALEAHHLVN